MGETHDAEQISWDAPGGISMTLIPEPGGVLQVRIDGEVVTLSGRHCRHLQGEEGTRKPRDVTSQLLAEVHLTLLTTRCLITWKSVPAPAQ